MPVTANDLDNILKTLLTVAREDIQTIIVFFLFALGLSILIALVLWFFTRRAQLALERKRVEREYEQDKGRVQAEIARDQQYAAQAQQQAALLQRVLTTNEAFVGSVDEFRKTVDAMTRAISTSAVATAEAMADHAESLRNFQNVFSATMKDSALARQMLHAEREINEKAALKALQESHSALAAIPEQVVAKMDPGFQRALAEVGKVNQLLSDFQTQHRQSHQEIVELLTRQFSKHFEQMNRFDETVKSHQTAFTYIDQIFRKLGDVESAASLIASRVQVIADRLSIFFAPDPKQQLLSSGAASTEPSKP